MVGDVAELGRGKLVNGQCRRRVVDIEGIRIYDKTLVLGCPRLLLGSSLTIFGNLHVSQVLGNSVLVLVWIG